jgi:hypothetical protein
MRERARRSTASTAAIANPVLSREALHGDKKIGDLNVPWWVDRGEASLGVAAKQKAQALLYTSTHKHHKQAKYRYLCLALAMIRNRPKRPGMHC